MPRFHVWLATTALFVLFSMVGRGLGAQHSARLTVTPFGGFLAPGGEVPSAPFLDSGSRLGFGGFGPSWALGGALELGAPSPLIGLRLSAVRSLGAQETGQWSCGPSDDPRAFCPSILIRVPTEVSITRLGVDLTGDVHLGPLAVHPSVGVGWAWYRYRWQTRPGSTFSLEPGTARGDGAGLLGGLGVSVPFAGRSRLRADWSQLFLGGESGERTRPERLGHLALGAELTLLP